MTTAYTPILKLALPVTGELNGTWGDVVNNNITSMVEQAVAGLATINTWTTASHTLTTADGTTSESRCAILECSGAPGAAATVICPALSKVYIIKNSVTGGYAVTLKTSAGTGISVPNGSTALLYCDGTNVVSGATYTATLSTTQVDILAQGDLRLQDSTGGEYVALQAPSTIATSYTLTLPVDDGTAGQALITDGSGVLSWSTAASGDVYGPASATDNAVARFDLTTGKLIQNSAVTIDDTGNMAGVGTLSSGAITSSALTSGRVPYAGTAGLIQDSANLTFDGTNLTVNGTAYLGGTSTTQSLRVTPVASAVNYLNAQGNSIAGPVSISAAGSDTNIDFSIIPKGTGGTQIYGTGQTVAAITTTTFGGSLLINDVGSSAGNGGAVVFGAASGAWRFAAIKSFATNGSNNTQGDLYFLTRRANTDATLTAAMQIKSGGTLSLGSAFGSESLRVTPVASAVNYWSFYGREAGSAPYVQAEGSDTNIDLLYAAKGSGGHGFYTAGFSFTQQFRIAHTASAVNYLQVTGGATGASTTLSAQGTDTNIDLTLTPKGSGYVVVDAAYSPNLTLTDAATITWDTSTAGGQVATFTFVSSNRTMGAPTNLKNGGFYALAVIQNAGSNTLTWNAIFKWAGGTAPTLSTAAAAKDYFVFRSDGTNLYQQGISQAVA